MVPRSPYGVLGCVGIRLRQLTDTLHDANVLFNLIWLLVDHQYQVRQLIIRPFSLGFSSSGDKSRSCMSISVVVA